MAESIASSTAAEEVKKPHLLLKNGTSAPAPPRGLRERVLHALPSYSGPHSVGTMEIEMPARDPRTFSHIKREHDYALRLQTVLFAIYYPCDLKSYAKTGNRPSRATWLPRPRVRTCKGYAKFFNVPHFPVTAYIAATTMFTKLPAFRNATLTSIRPGERVDSQDGHVKVDGVEVEKPKFPVIIFSHGLGGSRTLYSSICGELASHGFIVVAMEHRDGSGARSYVNIPPTSDMPRGDADKPTDKKSYLVDYIVPKDNAQDTSPQNAKGVDTELRNAQIEMRMAEVEEAYHVLQLINNGQGDQVYKANLRKKGNIGSSSKGLEGIDWSDWAGRMFLEEKVTIMGHSFGGATSVQIARSHKRFPWIGQGVLLDAWGPATPVLEQDAQDERLRKPMLLIGSEAFMHWDENFQRMSNICQEAKDGGSYGWMMTIKGSTHLSQTDFSVLYPNWMSWLFKTIVHPKRAIHLTVNASLEFFKRVLPGSHTVGSTWVDEGILRTKAMAPEDDLPDDFKPEGKWIAARLRIPNEFRLRLMSWFRRPPKTEVPTDAAGNPLAGIVVWKPGEEVWMHTTPSKEQLERPKPPRGWLSRKSTANYSFTRQQCVVT